MEETWSTSLLNKGGSTAVYLGGPYSNLAQSHSGKEHIPTSCERIPQREHSYPVGLPVLELGLLLVYTACCVLCKPVLGTHPRQDLYPHTQEDI